MKKYWIFYVFFFEGLGVQFFDKKDQYFYLQLICFGLALGSVIIIRFYNKKE